MKKIVAWLLVLALVLGVVAAAVSLFLSRESAANAYDPAPPVAPSGTPAADEAPDPALEQFYSQDLDWSGCGDGDECATLTVPLDYADPTGETIGIHVLRRPADDQDDKVSSLLVNPGGPGVAGSSMASNADSYFRRPFLTYFDIIGFDPRGTGQSSPIDCLTDEGLDDYLSGDPEPETPVEARTYVRTSRSMGRGCERLSPGLASHISTVEAARDMDVLRAALGEQVMTYYGASYGTQLGSTYAELFPERVGRLVLDGAVDPTLTVREEALTQAGGFETALGAYVQNCIDSTDSCFLGSTVDEGLQRISDLIDEVDAEPLVVGDRELTAGLAVYGIITPLYNRDYWILLSQGLQAAFDGDGSVLLQLADAYASRDSDGGYADNSMEAFPAISCLDDPSGIRPAQVPDEIPEFEEASPTFGRIYAWGLISCRNWPAARGLDPEPLTIDAAGAAPIVVVGTTRDPATPYSWAEALAAQLDSGVLVTRDGDGHTGYNSGNECTSEAVESYLIEGKVPRDGLTC